MTPSGGSYPQRELPGTYVVQDRTNEEEHLRLQIQDQLITTGMGGVLPEHADPSMFHRILDVGCGPGGWLIETARTYPTISRLVGVDVNKQLLSYARTQAETQQVSDRVQFRAMDALLMLEFPDNSFDLVNERFGDSYLRIWDWPKLLSEFQRVTRPGGIIRTTESEIVIESTSPALTRILEIGLDAFYHAGHAFTPTTTGVISELAALLQRYGIRQVQTQTHEIYYHAGTTEGQRFYEDMKRTIRTILPFYRKWSRVPDDYDAICQQALNEMQQPDFVATWRLLTAWGLNPPKRKESRR